MTAHQLSYPSAPAPRLTIEQWRRRSRLVRVARLALPAAIAAILGALAFMVALNAIEGRRPEAQDANQPIRLVNPHFVGRDQRGRSFLITSVTAVRDPAHYNFVRLDHPTMVVEASSPDPTRLTARSGLYNEDTHLLELTGAVRLSSSHSAMQTESSVFDTKTGEVTGSGAVQGSSALGEIQAKSYAVYDWGDRMVFKGAVHTRLIPKQRSPEGQTR
jgi:lipopolysaccharide export system protein LptC